MKRAEEVVEALKWEKGGGSRGGAASCGGRACGAGSGGADAGGAAEVEPGWEARVNTSEPEVRTMRMADGMSVPAWNLQLPTETAGNVVVGVDVTSQGSDAEQLSGMLEQMRPGLGRVPERMLADGGYPSRSNVEYAHRAGIELYAPWGPAAARHQGGLVRNGIAKEFGSQAFLYDAGNEVLICPGGRAAGAGAVVVEERGAEGALRGCGGGLRTMPAPGRLLRAGRGAGRVGGAGRGGRSAAGLPGPHGQPGRPAVLTPAEPVRRVSAAADQGVLGLRPFHGGWRKVRQEGMLWALAQNRMQ